LVCLLSASAGLVIEQSHGLYPKFENYSCL
jgi:hypothetical protein